MVDVGRLPDGAPYIVMEYLRGVDLAAELARRGALPPGLAVDYVLQACEALAEAHAHGIVHRDIKPGNLFLTTAPRRHAADQGPRLRDLQGAGRQHRRSTQTDTVMGTPGYMSPEQMKAARDVDARTDIWSLGIVLYECLAGRPPFQAEAFSAVVLKAATEPPPPMDPRLPRGLQDVVLRCLAKDRAARFASMAELAAALAPFAGDQRAAALVVDRTRLMLGAALGAPAMPGVPVAPAVPVAPGAPARPGRNRCGASGLSIGERHHAAGHLRGSHVDQAVPLHDRRCGVARERDRRADRRGGDSLGRLRRRAPVPDPATAVAALPVTSPDAAVNAAVNAAANAAVADARAAGDPQGPTQGGAAAAGLDPEQKAAICLALEARRDWQGLRDCASELAALAGSDPAVRDRTGQLRQKAVMEVAAAISADKAQAALREGNLREAQKQLKAIPPDSASWPAVGDALRAAEAQAVEDARRRAQALAAAHDCPALKRLHAQLTSSGTPAVAAAVAAVKCVDRATPAGPTATDDHAAAPNAPCDAMSVDDVLTQAQNQNTAGFPRSALQLVLKALACRQDARMYRLAAAFACAAHDAAHAQQYYRKLAPPQQKALAPQCQAELAAAPEAPAPASAAPPPQAPATPPGKSVCDVISVDDIVSQAQNQFAAGFSKAALQLITKALACKQDVRMYRFAAMFACAARDLKAAKEYYSKVPPQFQPAIAQRCQVEGLAVP